MRRWTRSAIAIAAVLALAATACATDTDDTGTATGTTDGRSIDLTIGAVLPLTGALSDFGPAMSRGAELAVEIFEETASELGHDVSVEVVTEDSQTDPAAAVEAARKLADTQGVNVIVGAAASAATLAVANSVTIPEGIAQCSPASTSGDITGLEDQGLVNRTPPSDEHQAPILAKVVMDELGEGATVNLGARNDAYGTFLIDGVEAELRSLGATIGAKTLWDPEAATYDSEAQQIASGSPDGWVLIDFPGTWQKMGPALVRTGQWDAAKTFSADGLKVSGLAEDVGEEAVVGMKGTGPGGTQAFNALWDERVRDIQRETFDSHTFDCTMLLLLAALKAESSDGEDIAAELQAISGPGGEKVSFENLDEAMDLIVEGEEIDYEGASGPIDLDEAGDPESVGAVYEIYEFTADGFEVVSTERVSDDGTDAEASPGTSPAASPAASPAG